MGFNAGARTLNLDFTGTPWEGAEVRVRTMPLGRTLELTQGDGPVAVGPAMFDVLAEHLASWNLELDGRAVPLTTEGLHAVDGALALAIVRTWFETMTSLAEGSELGKGSGSGVTSLAASLPMEPLSPGRAS